MDNLNLSSNEFVLKYAKIIAVIYLLLVYPLSVFMPYEMTWENGLVENLQNLVLLAACLVNAALYFRRKTVGYKREKMHLWQALFFAVLTARELSWGRVFFVTGMTPDGPLFIDFTPQQHMLLHGVLGVIFLLLAIMMLRWVPWSKVFSFNYEIPWVFLLVIILSTIMARVGEKGYFGIGHNVGQGMEEIAELNVYFCLCCLSAWYDKTFCGH